MNAKNPVRNTFVRVCILAVALVGLAANAGAQEHWVATWAVSPQSAHIVFPGLPRQLRAPPPRRRPRVSFFPRRHPSIIRPSA